MAAYGAQLKQGKSRTRPRRTSRTSSTTCPCRKSAREALQTFIGGRRRAALLRERGHRRAAGGRGRRLRRPRRDHPDRDPLAVTEDVMTPRWPRRSTTTSTRPRPRRLRLQGTARSSRASWARTSPDAAEPRHHRRPGRAGRGQRACCAPRQRDVHHRAGTSASVPPSSAAPRERCSSRLWAGRRQGLRRTRVRAAPGPASASSSCTSASSS